MVNIRARVESGFWDTGMPYGKVLGTDLFQLSTEGIAQRLVQHGGSDKTEIGSLIGLASVAS